MEEASTEETLAKPPEKKVLTVKEYVNFVKIMVLNAPTVAKT